MEKEALCWYGIEKSTPGQAAERSMGFMPSICKKENFPFFFF
jgi:hypothetical protein